MNKRMNLGVSDYTTSNNSVLRFFFCTSCFIQIILLYWHFINKRVTTSLLSAIDLYESDNNEHLFRLKIFHSALCVLLNANVEYVLSEILFYYNSTWVLFSCILYIQTFIRASNYYICRLLSVQQEGCIVANKKTWQVKSVVSRKRDLERKYESKSYENEIKSYCMSKYVQRQKLWEFFLTSWVTMFSP